MRLRAVFTEIWKDTISGMARSGSLTVCVFLMVFGCAGIDAMQIIALEGQVNEFKNAEGDVSLLKSTKGIDGRICSMLDESTRIEASGALRQHDDMTLLALPHNPITVYEVTDGFLDVVDGSRHDHQGIWLPYVLAEKLGVQEGSMIQTTQGVIRIAGVYDWAEDGRDSRLGYAVLVPVPAAGAFDECWTSVWPMADVSTEMRQSVYASSDPSKTQTGSLNYARGESLDAYGLFASRLTRFAMPTCWLAMLVLSFVFCHRRRLEIAGDLHVGASKTLILVQMIGERMIPVFMGMIMAYSTLFIFVEALNPTSSDSLAIFLLELRSGMPLPCAAAAGTMIAVLLIRETHLYRLFKSV